MDAFKNFANKYLESGFSVIPLNGKRPLIEDWQKYSDELPTEAAIDSWCRDFPNANIGLVCGKASGVVCFDFDYEGSDQEKVENILNQLLPPSPVRKCGKKKWSAFYRYNGINSTYFQRGKLRLADFLSSGKQTVIPPSIHPDTGSAYRWITDVTLLDVAAIDLPELTADVLEKVDMLKDFDFTSKENPFSERNGRHDTIVAYGLAVIEKCVSVEDLVERMVAYDLKKFPGEEYFKDAKYFKHKDPMKEALRIAKSLEKFVGRAKKKKGVEWKMGQEFVPELNDTEYKEFCNFFNRLYPTAKKCFLTGEVSYPDGFIRRPVLNEIKMIRANAMINSLPRQKAEDYLDKWVSEMPKQMLVDIPEWDGVDHIGKVLSYVSVENISHAYFVELIKEWFACIFMRINDPFIQNKMVIFGGAQGIGKDTFIENLFKDFRPYFTSSRIYEKENDNFGIMARKVVINISEFDRTSRVEVSQLKNIITAAEATFRAPYARTSESVQFRTSFISSCNIEDIFRDETGNRRYMFFKIGSIDWNYPKGLSLQILAQAKALAAKKFVASIEATETMTSIVKEMTPESWESYADEIWNEEFRTRVAFSPGSSRHLPYHKISDIVEKIAKSLGIGQRMVQGFIKKKYQKKIDNKRLYFFREETLRNLNERTDVAVLEKVAVPD